MLDLHRWKNHYQAEIRFGLIDRTLRIQNRVSVGARAPI
jgi:hypothetical protein